MDPSRLQIEALNKSEPTTSVTKKAGIEIPAYFYVFGVRRFFKRSFPHKTASLW